MEGNFNDQPTLSLSAISVPLPSPVKAYSINIGRRKNRTLEWEAPEWDLAECGRIVDVESIFSRALRTQLDLFVKEGYEFTGPNPERNNYIINRLAQMEIATNTPFPILINETISSLRRCSNAFWVKVRNYEASGGKKRYIGTKEINPVAGYYLLPAESVQIKRDEYGLATKYRQQVYGKEPKDFNPEDVVHFYFDRRPGFAVGTPSVVSVKDDIQALRRIEEQVELLIYQHLFPLFHYTVGTDDKPATITPDGEDEVIQVQRKVAQMPSDGCWVTSERHTIKSIDAPSPPIAVEKVLEYFKHRIYIGLGVSPIDMGESGQASRSTAQTVSRNLINNTKAYQKEFGAQFYHYIIRELLLESTFSVDTLFNPENKVFLKFKEIDQETRIAKENHLTDMFLKNMVTHDEVRIDSGRQPFVGDGWPTSTSKATMFTKGDGDWAKTNYGLIERDKVILQSLDEPGTDASKEETKSRSAANVAKTAGGNSVSNKNQPQNQHGTRNSAKLNKDFEDSIPELDIVFKQTMPMLSSYNVIKDDIINRVRDKGLEQKVVDFNINYTFTEAINRLVSLAKRSFRIGLQKTKQNPWSIDLSRTDAQISDRINKYVRRLQKDISDSINKHTIGDIGLKDEDATFISIIFDTLEYRADLIDKSEIFRAYNYGLMTGFRMNGIIEVSSVYTNDGDCQICKSATLQTYNTNAIIYEELHPLHPKCSCTYKPKG